MRVVSIRTGLTPDLLRAWERRYGVVAPTRSGGGQRLYSEADIDRLALLVRAVNGGRPISQVASLPVDELRVLVAQDEKSARDAPTATVAPSPGDRVSALREALSAVERFDAETLESILRKAALRDGMDALLDSVVAPLLIEIGSRWHEGGLSPAHEHLASAVVRHALSWMMENGAQDDADPVLVIATLPNQQHELGAMLAAAVAASRGWRVVYLGANLPAADIAVAAQETGAAAVGLSFVYPPDDPAISGALRDLRVALPATTSIVAGGAAAENYAASLGAAGAVTIGSTREWRSWLQRAARS
jgi:DNA-binding transcriptional MerR regulator/methylmalonyl-CoA mutase cobalamin-binding subunit